MKKLNIKLGGSFDTIAITLIIMPQLAWHPLFYNRLTMYYVLFLTFLGGLMLSWRFLEPYRTARVIKSKLNFKSAIPPRGYTNEDYLIGYDTQRGLPICLYDDILKRHALIIGQSGTGKSVLMMNLMFQQALRRGGGLLYIDGKNDFGDFEKFYNLMTEIGRQDDILIVNIDRPEMSNTYNPILFGDPDEIAARIISLIPLSETSPGSMHYRSESTQALVTLIAALQFIGEAYSFIDLNILLMSIKALRELEKKLIAKDSTHESTINFRLFLSKFIRNGKFDLSEFKKTFGGVAGYIYLLGTGKFGQVTNTYTPDVNLFDVVTKNKILYVMLPTLGKAETASIFGKLLVSDLRTTVSWMQKIPKSELPNPPFLCVMDEAGSYVNANWSRLFEQARSANMVMMPAVQTDSNFKAISPELLSMVEGNTWTKIYLKIGDIDTAERVAKNIGTTRAVKQTLTETENTSESKQNLQVAPNANVGDGAGISRGQQYEKVEVVTADQLKDLGIGECICFVDRDELYHVSMPQIKPINKYEYKKNSFYKPDVIGINLRSKYEEYIDTEKKAKNDDSDEDDFEDVGNS